MVLNQPFSRIIRMLMVTFGMSVHSLSLAVSFQSRNGITEQCYGIAPIPGGSYSQKDQELEQKYCSVDFYSTQVALCGKQKSTSPGTYIYKLTDSGWTQAEAENKCSQLDVKADKIGTFKQTINQADTSGTFSGAPLLYYHLSRYFQTVAYIPPAVYRTMDRREHLGRVSLKTQGKGAMNIAGWKHLRNAEKSPATYNERTRLFTDGDKQIFGAIIKSSGNTLGPYYFGPR
jgi:hypothetical protein